eukprot:scaffold97570_cov72-Phaeocystis_antarctica.AAC.4
MAAFASLFSSLLLANGSTGAAAGWEAVGLRRSVPFGRPMPAAARRCLLPRVGPHFSRRMHSYVTRSESSSQCQRESAGHSGSVPDFPHRSFDVSARGAS